MLKTRSSAGSESDRPLAPEVQLAGRPDRRDPGVDRRRVAGHRVVADQAEDHRDVGAMPLAGLGQRAEQVDADPLDSPEDPKFPAPRRETAAPPARAPWCASSTARRRS